MIAFAPCKINIGLQVTAKRTDGYHELSSVFYPVPLHDIIEIVENYTSLEKCKFTSSGIQTNANDGDNLCVKAYSLLDKDFNLPPALIHLHKQIPVGAGLGGGSSDASQVLKMLNEKFTLNLTADALLNYAAMLGSDCPFFIKSSPQIATGRGEILNDINLNLSGFYLLLVKPHIFISTKEAYSLITPSPSAFDLNRLSVTDITNWKNYVTNDFEAPLFKKYHLLKDIKNHLYQSGAVYAAMSGSGSAMFGIFESEPKTSIPFLNCNSVIKKL
jgi:4-diphosphocytidyl-2-C-methyl-D-erythritol kinase